MASTSSNFDELPADGWVHCNPPGSHWKNGFNLAKPVVEAEYLLWTCCLKTHQFGGVHSMSLKLAVGVVEKKVRFPEMHASKDHMRHMIAELNYGFKPQLIVMDGVDIFVDGGPMTGKPAKAGIIVAGTDRIAIDAVGLAVLKNHGANDAIMSKKIFEQSRSRRAVELGLGVKSRRIKSKLSRPTRKARATPVSCARSLPAASCERGKGIKDQRDKGLRKKSK